MNSSVTFKLHARVSMKPASLTPTAARKSALMASVRIASRPILNGGYAREELSAARAAASVSSAAMKTHVLQGVSSPQTTVSARRIRIAAAGAVIARNVRSQAPIRLTVHTLTQRVSGGSLHSSTSSCP